jgi:bacterioferritin-associated ferredoxin
VGNKYRNMTLQVGVVTEIETIKYVHEFCGTQKGCGRCPKKLNNIDPTSRQRGCPTSITP